MQWKTCVDEESKSAIRIALALLEQKLWTFKVKQQFLQTYMITNKLPSLSNVVTALA
jgi:hypothetical protein